MLNVLLLLVGLGLIVFGANALVDGASTIARKAGVSEFVIGLTIVGFGTSCPELVVSLTGAIQGNPDIAIGNVVGSNIFNVLFILALTAIISPVAMTKENHRIDIPMTFAVSLLLVLLGLNSTLFGIGDNDSISRAEGLVFLLLFAGYVYFCFKNDKAADEVPSESGSEGKAMKMPVAVLFVLLGLGGLIFGG
ncbi:MAG TPA: sodium:proton exchanger, partial [Rikenellaceae bacterium]|nr:sodium:proton exchanger [Rikenellaceae bacterium]